MTEKVIEFIRKRDYVLVKELGQGATGKTVLLMDDIINENLVCKKYSPYSEERRADLFQNFLREIKLLHKIFHPNIVRVFNYYVYPDKMTGYILMEFVEGKAIEDFLFFECDRINEIFIQAIDGFAYLENNKILHRDIRSSNLIVRNDGILKIIDLGFGKEIKADSDFEKSIHLNQWCDSPAEFARSIYDFKSEVYFVGKLFQKIIQENKIESFKCSSLLDKMCHFAHEFRIDGFQQIQNEIRSNQFIEIEFSEEEIQTFQVFTDALEEAITRIKYSAKHHTDIQKVQTQLENTYRSIMFEEIVPDSSKVINCFLDGEYLFKRRSIEVRAVRNFLALLKTLGVEKKKIVLSNVQSRLDSLSHYEDPPPDEGEVPF